MYRCLVASLLLASAALLSAGVASAQTLCTDLGGACDGGECVPASCTFETTTGPSANMACGLCVIVPSGECIRGYNCPAGCPGHVDVGSGGVDASALEAGALVGYGYLLGTCAESDAGPSDAGPSDAPGDAIVDAAHDVIDEVGLPVQDATPSDEVGPPIRDAQMGDEVGRPVVDAAVGATTSVGNTGGCSVMGRSVGSGACSFAPLALVGLAFARRRRARG